MEDRAWKLGEGLRTCDNLLGGITFDELILTVRCSCRSITPEAVRKELRDILADREQDSKFLLENYMEAIVTAVKLGGKTK